MNCEIIGSIWCIDSQQFTSNNITRKLLLFENNRSDGALLESLITSKTRIKLMLRFFLNPGSQAYLRGLAEELGESTNSIRVELNRLTKAGLLEAEKEGRTVLYKANVKHALFSDIHNLVIKYTGIDQLIDAIVKNLGDLECVLIIGDYAKGIDSGIIDLVIVGQIDRGYLNFLAEKVETLIKRKIRCLVLNKEEYAEYIKKWTKENHLFLWGKEQGHAGD